MNEKNESTDSQDRLIKQGPFFLPVWPKCLWMKMKTSVKYSERVEVHFLWAIQPL